MSLMKTLARVAAGVMVAKGIGHVMQNQANAGRRGQDGGSAPQSGSLLDQLLSNNTGGGGSLKDALGQVLGNGRQGGGSAYGGPNSRGASGGLGGILDQLTQVSRGQGGKGGLGGILGQLSGGTKTAGGGGGGGGGLGDLLGGLLGGAAAGGAAAGGLARKDSQPTNNASFGELFNDALSHDAEPEVAPTPEQNAVAGLMLRAMIQAAKADGRIDEGERQRLTEHLGDLDEEERQFIREQMAAPVDVASLAAEVPSGLEAQVYLMSLLAINFDSPEEARYLDGLAQALRIGQGQINRIHDEVGATRLYS